MLTSSIFLLQNTYLSPKAFILGKVQMFQIIKFELGRFEPYLICLADFYGVDIRTVENCLSVNEDELRHNGYFLCRGNSLKEFKLRFAQDIDVPNKTPQIGLFDFRSFLNIGMLLARRWLIHLGKYENSHHSNYYVV